MKDAGDYSAALSWYWRWGVPLIVGLSALAAAATLADWLWGFGVVAAQSTDGDPEELRVAVGASVLSLCLLACWLVVRHQRRASSLPEKPEPLAVGGRARTEVVMAAIVIGTGVALHAYFLDLPWRSDEGATVKNLAYQPFGTVLSSYQYTNNHPLHTLLVWVVHQFGGLNRIALRLPAFLSFCILLPVLWWFARREYGPTAAAFATAFVAAVPYSVASSTNARGYTLLLLLFMGALLCGQSLVREPDRRRLWAAWAATIGLGFFTVPLMALPAATTAIWMLLTRWRLRGRHGLASFAFKIAGWSAAALVLAGALYAPVLATVGVEGMQQALAKAGSNLPKATLLHNLDGLLWHPVVVWHRWQWPSPAWVQAVVVTMVLVGVGVPAWTGRCAGALALAALSVATVAKLATPTLFPPRMLIWMLLVFMILAGAGAAAVLDGLVARWKDAWPKLAEPSWRTAATCGAVALVLVSYGRCALMADMRTYGLGDRGPVRLLPMAAATLEQTRVGDCFTVHGWASSQTALHMMNVRGVDVDVGWYYPLNELQSRWPVHRISAPAGGRPSPDVAHESMACGRLFVFQGWGLLGERTLGAEGLTAREFLEVQGISHEFVAAFDDGSVFLLNDWTMHP